MPQLSEAVSSADHTTGPANAPVTLVEYGDFQCPTCGEAYPIVKRLQKHFGDRLRFAFRNFPLEQHEFAEPAAELAEFAATKDKFWPVHDAIYEGQSHLSYEWLVQTAQQQGLDADAAAKAVDEQAFQQHIDHDLETGEASGLRGTPTFYINGSMHDGSFDFDTLREAIENAA